MERIKDTLDFHIADPTVVAIGKFDGVHKGHGEIIKHMLSYKARGYKCAILTFDIPPVVVTKHEESHVLTDNDVKAAVFDKLGIDIMVEFPFYEKTAAIGPGEFVEDVLIGKMHMKAIVAGDDCRFGYRGAGNADLLVCMGRECGFETEIIPKLTTEYGEVISSTYLRELVKEGRIDEAASLCMDPNTMHA